MLSLAPLAAYSFIRREKSSVRKVPGSLRCPKSSVRHSYNMSGQSSAAKISPMGITCCFMVVLLVSLLGSGTAQDVANVTDSPMIIVEPMANATFDGRRIDKSTCHSSRLSFEIITGYVYSAASEETLRTVPETLQLTDCLQHCRNDVRCQSVNFETGLCILLNTSASDSGEGALRPSQFPVFTIYAQKVCLSDRAGRACGSRAWIFERVIGYELRGQAKKQFQVEHRSECMDACLTDPGLTCRSFNYNKNTGECSLSDMDRHTLSTAGQVRGTQHFRSADEPLIDYFESNCVQEVNKMCDFKPIKGKIMKTVDSVWQGVTSDDECRRRCLESDSYRCFSYDLGDPSSQVCRTSHLDSSSLTHINEAYFTAEGAVTYELASCFNVSILCGAQEMRTIIRTNRMFNGKVYDRRKPNSCMSDIQNSMDFELVQNYINLECDVNQTKPGNFISSLVIQHHDLIVTSSDLGLNVECSYDLSNRTVNNVLNLDESERFGDVLEEGTKVHSATVAAPNISMVILSNGESVQKARVGDQLTMQFIITDQDSPYGIFVRELIALDGSNAGELVLIDANGCPTDDDILGPLVKGKNGRQIVEASFQAFKFPTSDTVQLKAIITPCVTSCAPVQCGPHSSLGRRRRAAKMATGLAESGSSTDDKLVIVQTLTIEENFSHKEKKPLSADDLIGGSGLRSYGPSYQLIRALLAGVSLFLVSQALILIIWVRRTKQRNQDLFEGQQSAMGSRADLIFSSPHHHNQHPFNNNQQRSAATFANHH